MRRLLLPLIFLLCCTDAGAQENSFVFSHLNEDDGLSDNVINCFLKDSRGILWIGTFGGFSRFDGSNFYNYKKRKGDNSMLTEVVHRLCEDKKGYIWGATDNGAFCYIPQQDRFINYSIKSLGRSAVCFNIICDRQGTVWVCGRWSLFKYNAAKDLFEEAVKLTEVLDSANNYRISKNGILEDASANGFWLTTSAGLMYYDKTKQQLLNYKNRAGDSLFKHRDVSAVASSTQGNAWFFDNGQKEMVLFNMAAGREIRKINIRKEMPAANGATLFEDSHRRLWFSSWAYGLLLIDQQNNNQVYKLQHLDDDKRSVAGIFFWAAYEDPDKNIWLGTVAGISMCNPERIMYRKYQLPNIIPELKNTSIRLAEKNPADSTIWIMTASSLLIQYNPANQHYNIFSFKDVEAGPGEAVPGNYTSIKFFRGNTIITTRSGIWQVKKGSRQITPFGFLPEGFKDFKCVDMAIDGDSVLYYTNGAEVLYWNYTAGKSQRIRYEAKPGSATVTIRISCFSFTAAHQLWMIMSGPNIARLTADKKLVLTEVITDKVKENGTLMSIDQDLNGNVWVLNKGAGIYDYNPTRGSIKLWSEVDGLAGSRIHKLLTDSAGRVWGMAYNKISVYTPGTGKFYNFKVPGNESDLNYYNHISRMPNGNIMGSINNEIVEFYPERLLGTPAKIKPQISQLIVSGKDIPLFNNTDIVLQPNENTIRLRFGALINKEIFPYEIEYKLVGAEKEWTIAGENHEALYNNLNPGRYSFHVRVKGKNSSWETEEAVITFKIKIPFYKSAWFLTAVLLLLAAFLFFIYRYRVNQQEKLLSLENKAQALEKEKAMVMYENLKQQLNPHFLFNSLTSLNSLIEEESGAASEFLDSLSKTYRYILKSRDNETVPLVDEIRFAENYVKLQKTRFEKGFVVNINIPEEYYYRKIVPVTIQNLIENAIKHNVIDEERPLIVNIYVEDGLLLVENNLQRKKNVSTSNRQGLANMQSLYRYLSNQPVEIIETTEFFKIKLPLL